jgi:hypothetical protein
MPQFLLKVLGSSSPRTGVYPLVGVAELLSARLSVLGVKALNDVANGKILIPDDVAWPVYGSFMEPCFSVGVSPLVVTMQMNTTYRGFNFGGQRSAVHAALRREIWTALCGIAADEYVDFDGPKGARSYGMHAFTVRVECGIASGSDVLASGVVVGEYGGDTGVTRLELPV